MISTMEYLSFCSEKNLDNDITLDGMTINKEGAFGPCIFWEVEIQGDITSFCTLCLN